MRDQLCLHTEPNEGFFSQFEALLLVSSWLQPAQLAEETRGGLLADVSNKSICFG